MPEFSQFKPLNHKLAPRYFNPTLLNCPRSEQSEEFKITKVTNKKYIHWRLDFP